VGNFTLLFVILLYSLWVTLLFVGFILFYLNFMHFVELMMPTA